MVPRILWGMSKLSRNYLCQRGKIFHGIIVNSGFRVSIKIITFIKLKMGHAKHKFLAFCIKFRFHVMVVLVND